MTWRALESKMLSAAAYDDSNRAESKGRFFRSRIRDFFRYERMAKLHAA
jgi:hypothetical protein